MKKIKLIAVAAAAFALVALVLAGCSSGASSSAASASSDGASASSESASASSASAVEIDKLVVGFDQEYPPYGYIGDDGEFTGFDLELAQEVCARNGWEYVAQPINWDTKLEELNAGAFDCIWNGFTMQGREGDYAFSEPYMDNGQVVLVKADSDIQDLDDLAGKVVATQVDSAAEELLVEGGDQAELGASFAALETRDTYAIAVTELDAGAFDALACDLSIAAFYTAGNPDAYRVLPTNLSEESYAVAFRTTDTALADQVTSTLRDMVADGFVQDLCAKYADDGITFDNWLLK